VLRRNENAFLVALVIASKVEESLIVHMSPLIFVYILIAFFVGAGVVFVLMRQTKSQLSDHLKSLCSDALESNSKTFVQIAKGELDAAQNAAKNDLENRQRAIDNLVKPVGESLGKLNDEIRRLENARTGAYSQLTQQLGSLLQTENQLRAETGKLVQALRSPIVRGRWGEIQLRRVVELAGMVDHCDFTEQTTISTEDGRLRPDLIVHLPKGKTIVVDTKTPLNAYLDALEAEEHAKSLLLVQHAKHVRAQIESLSRKAYWEQFDNAPEFVVLFLPGEMFFSAALERDPLLIEFGADKRIILATPTTLIALLRAVHYGWSQEKLAENALAISKLGSELYKRLSVMGDHFIALGKSINACVSAFNRIAGNIESRVFVTARKFRALGVAETSEDIASLPQLDQVAREIQVDELDHQKELEM
jgi:DNA recombination protein RmuC